MSDVKFDISQTCINYLDRHDVLAICKIPEWGTDEQHIAAGGGFVQLKEIDVVALVTMLQWGNYTNKDLKAFYERIREEVVKSKMSAHWYMFDYDTFTVRIESRPGTETNKERGKDGQWMQMYAAELGYTIGEQKQLYERVMEIPEELTKLEQPAKEHNDQESLPVGYSCETLDTIECQEPANVNLTKEQLKDLLMAFGRGGKGYIEATVNCEGQVSVSTQTFIDTDGIRIMESDDSDESVFYEWDDMEENTIHFDNTAEAFIIDLSPFHHDTTLTMKLYPYPKPLSLDKVISMAHFTSKQENE